MGESEEEFYYEEYIYSDKYGSENNVQDGYYVNEDTGKEENYEYEEYIYYYGSQDPDELDNENIWIEEEEQKKKKAATEKAKQEILLDMTSALCNLSLALEKKIGSLKNTNFDNDGCATEGYTEIKCSIPDHSIRYNKRKIDNSLIHKKKPCIITNNGYSNSINSSNNYDDCDGDEYNKKTYGSAEEEARGIIEKKITRGDKQRICRKKVSIIKDDNPTKSMTAQSDKNLSLFKLYSSDDNNYIPQKEQMPQQVTQIEKRKIKRRIKPVNQSAPAALDPYINNGNTELNNGAIKLPIAEHEEESYNKEKMESKKPVNDSIEKEKILMSFMSSILNNNNGNNIYNKNDGSVGNIEAKKEPIYVMGGKKYQLFSRKIEEDIINSIYKSLEPFVNNKNTDSNREDNEKNINCPNLDTHTTKNDIEINTIPMTLSNPESSFTGEETNTKKKEDKKKKNDCVIATSPINKKNFITANIENVSITHNGNGCKSKLLEKTTPDKVIAGSALTTNSSVASTIGKKIVDEKSILEEQEKQENSKKQIIQIKAQLKQEQTQRKLLEKQIEDIKKKQEELLIMAKNEKDKKERIKAELNQKITGKIPTFDGKLSILESTSIQANPLSAQRRTDKSLDELRNNIMLEKKKILHSMEVQLEKDFAYKSSTILPQQVENSISNKANYTEGRLSKNSRLQPTKVENYGSFSWMDYPKKGNAATNLNKKDSSKQHTHLRLSSISEVDKLIGQLPIVEAPPIIDKKNKKIVDQIKECDKFLLSKIDSRLQHQNLPMDGGIRETSSDAGWLSSMNIDTLLKMDTEYLIQKKIERTTLPSKTEELRAKYLPEISVSKDISFYSPRFLPFTENLTTENGDPLYMEKQLKEEEKRDPNGSSDITTSFINNSEKYLNKNNLEQSFSKKEKEIDELETKNNKTHQKLSIKEGMTSLQGSNKIYEDSTTVDITNNEYRIENDIGTGSSELGKISEQQGEEKAKNNSINFDNNDNNLFDSCSKIKEEEVKSILSFYEETTAKLISNKATNSSNTINNTSGTDIQGNRYSSSNSSISSSSFQNNFNKGDYIIRDKNIIPSSSFNYLEDPNFNNNNKNGDTNDSDINVYVTATKNVLDGVIYRRAKASSMDFYLSPDNKNAYVLTSSKPNEIDENNKYAKSSTEEETEQKEHTDCKTDKTYHNYIGNDKHSENNTNGIHNSILLVDHEGKFSIDIDAIKANETEKVTILFGETNCINNEATSLLATPDSTGVNITDLELSTAPHFLVSDVKTNSLSNFGDTKEEDLKADLNLHKLTLIGQANNEIFETEVESINNNKKEKDINNTINCIDDKECTHKQLSLIETTILNNTDLLFTNLTHGDIIKKFILEKESNNDDVVKISLLLLTKNGADGNNCSASDNVTLLHNINQALNANRLFTAFIFVVTFAYNKRINDLAESNNLRIRMTEGLEQEDGDDSVNNDKVLQMFLDCCFKMAPQMAIDFAREDLYKMETSIELDDDSAEILKNQVAINTLWSSILASTIGLFMYMQRLFISNNNNSKMNNTDQIQTENILKDSLSHLYESLAAIIGRFANENKIIRIVEDYKTKDKIISAIGMKLLLALITLPRALYFTKKVISDINGTDDMLTITGDIAELLKKVNIS